MMNWLEPYSRIELVDERIAKGVDETHLNDVQAGGLAGRLTCDRAGRQNGTHHRETQSALQTLVMEDDHQIAFNSQAIRVLLQHKDYDFIKQDGQWYKIW